ncbi:MAG: ABC transporter permease [Pyrinomonadaceae bacterium]
MPLLQGRGFNERDNADAPQVVVINETMARHLFPNEDPIGKRFRIGENSTQLREIIGVARDGKYRTLGESPRDFMFLPQLQRYTSEMTLAVGTRGRPAISRSVCAEK